MTPIAAAAPETDTTSAVLVEVPLVAPRHLKVASRRDGGRTLEWCEDPDCHVGPTGFADCGRLACPSCGQSGAALSATHPETLLHGECVRCECGHAWLPGASANAA